MMIISNNLFDEYIDNIVNSIGDWRPDYIVGITRGGLVPAVLVSHLTGIKMYTLDVRLRDGGDGEYDNESNCWMAEDAHAGKKILIVDDINDSGATLEWIKKDWNSSVYNMEDTVWHNNVRFACVVNNVASSMKIDYSGVDIDKSKDNQWVVFPWENN